MKIALVAMSGIRACNSELLALGLTLPGFVERSKTIASLPSLGLLTLAGMTPPEHQLTYLEIEDIRHFELWDSLCGHDLVAISSYSAQIDEAYELAAFLKRNGIQVVMGGVHVSHLPDEALVYCSSVIIGEGENVWTQVIEDGGVRLLKSRYGQLGKNFDLDDAPMPRFELLDYEKYNRLTVQTSRGCPHRCEFCASSINLTLQYKQKPDHKVLEEIDRIRDLWPKPFIEFADDNSFVNRSYWKRLLPELAKRKIRWFAETDISVGQDEELLDMMREAGCAQVLIGLESTDPHALNGLEQKRNWKYRQLEHYQASIEAIQSHGITVNGCFILGLDGQDASVFDAVFEYVKSCRLYEVQITLLTAFPGTPLYERLSKEGRLIEPRNWKKCTLFDVNFTPSHMTVDELERGFMDLGQRLYNSEFTDWRRRQFFEMRKTRTNS